MNVLVKKSIMLACKYHYDIKCSDGVTPSIKHPIDVLNRLLCWDVKDEIILSSAVLHDVIEKTNCSWMIIGNEVGFKIANLVNQLTSENNKELNFESSTEIILIKLADILENISYFKESNKNCMSELLYKRKNIIDFFESRKNQLELLCCVDMVRNDLSF